MTVKTFRELFGDEMRSQVGIKKAYYVDKSFSESEKLAKEKLSHTAAKEKSLLSHNQHAMTVKIPDAVDGYVEFVPVQARKMFGCLHCEWKSTPLCPFGFKRGVGLSVKKNSHVEGICQERINYLASFGRGYKKKPTFAEWHKDYMVGKASALEGKDYSDMEALYEKIIELNSKTEFVDEDDKKRHDKDVKVLKIELKSKRSDWHSIWKDIVAIEDRQVERDTPKKIETTERTVVSLSDINKAIRDYDRQGKAIDAEFDIIEED